MNEPTEAQASSFPSESPSSVHSTFDDDDNPEIVAGSTSKFEFTIYTYIGFGLIFLVVLFFLIWKYLTTRRHVTAGNMNDNLTQNQKETKTDKIEIELDDASEESKNEIEA